MPRKRRPLDRTSAVRSARLIVVATEDTKATPQYLNDLAIKYQNTRVQLKVLERDSTASSPQHVLNQLREFVATYQIGADDELWLVSDLDNWDVRMLSAVARECLQSGFRLAISNPAIELWFLLHLIDLSDYDASTLERLRQNTKPSPKATRTALEIEIVSKAGRYRKGRFHSADFLPYIQTAIMNAKALDTNPADRWPQTLGTRMYQLIESILESSTHYHR